jgi:hypothetical protein
VPEPAASIARGGFADINCMSTTRLASVERTMNATFAVVFPTMMAAALLAMAGMGVDFGETWGSPQAMCWLGCLAALSAFIIELVIRRQIWLAKNGEVVRGTVAEVRRLSNRNDNHIAVYYFAPPGRSAIESRGHISEPLSEVLRPGSDIEIVYDPNNPNRNAILDSLWAIEWE